MSETDACLEPVVARLQRELEHSYEQLKVEHAMTLSWKSRALKAEEKLAKGQKGRKRGDVE